MHEQALINAKSFSEKYLNKKCKILEIGSLDINGSIKDAFSGHEYTGMDIQNGKNVDIVSSSHAINIKSDSFDVILSTSQLEHDIMFWLTFKEMCRVLKPGGYIYICAPSSGEYHGYPVDCWRFYKDCYAGLIKWAEISGYNIKLIEQYISDNLPWKDNVMIFKKQ
jgi:SAM-dependent methyltransferase